MKPINRICLLLLVPLLACFSAGCASTAKKAGKAAATTTAKGAKATVQTGAKATAATGSAAVAAAKTVTGIGDQGKKNTDPDR